jgi:hypothetical protein
MGVLGVPLAERIEVVAFGRALAMANAAILEVGVPGFPASARREHTLTALSRSTYLSEWAIFSDVSGAAESALKRDGRVIRVAVC